MINKILLMIGGFARNTYRRRVREEKERKEKMVVDLKKRYSDLSLRDIGDMVGRSHEWVREILKKERSSDDE